MKDDPKEQPRFADMVVGVKRIKNDRVDPYSGRRSDPGLPRKGHRAETPVSSIVTTDFLPSSEAPEIHFNAGIQKKLQRRIRQGQLPIDDTLDLHGYKQNQALQELGKFVDFALKSNFRMLIIIHGKGFRSEGAAVLKPLVRNWLSQQESVLAWCQAQPFHGGDGASYVYLRKTD